MKRFEIIFPINFFSSENGSMSIRIGEIHPINAMTFALLLFKRFSVYFN